jgi:hypothetical protein
MDGWRTMELKALPLQLWEHRHQVEVLADRLGKLPTPYGHVSTPMLPKGEGRTAIDHRGLTLFPGLYRILSGAWWHQLQTWHNTWSHPCSHGGRKGHDITALAWEAQADIELAHARGRPLCGVLLDYEQFFDRFDINFSTNLLIAMGYPPQRAQQLRNLYSGLCRYIKLGEHDGEPLHNCNGIGQ